MEEINNKFLIYKTSDGKTHIDVKLQDETIWLTQKNMADLFGVKVPAINKHLNNIYREKELVKESTISKMEIVQSEGSRRITRDTIFYNLDAIISVGYRVNSARATEFRIWATQVLKNYLTQGFAINEKLLKSQQEKFEKIQSVIGLISTSVNQKISKLEDAKEMLNILDDFSKGLKLLDDFDHMLLDKKGITSKEATYIDKEEFFKIIEEMKSNFESDLFGKPKDESFFSSINQIYQSFGGQDLYPSIEEKAATLLYLITKNHSFLDGNKRIAASCFLYFLNKNKILYLDNKKPLIDNATLCSLTLLIAESNPKDMDIIKQVIISVLNRNR